MVKSGSTMCIPSSCTFWEHIQPQGKTRFNLLLLEHGEIYFGDYHVARFKLKGRSKVKFMGRLKVSSRSLVFDPTDVSQPLMRFAYKHMSRPMGYTPALSEEREFEPPLDGLLIFSATNVTEMKANDVVGPYVQRRCGEGDYEGPDFVFKLLHTQLREFLGLVHRLHDISAHLQRTASTVHAEEALLRPLIDEREKQAFDLSSLVDFKEKLLLPTPIPVDRISPLIKTPGVMMLTGHRLYFQPGELNNVGSSSTTHYTLASIVQVFKRRFMLRQTGLEIFYSEDGSSREEGGKVTSVLFAFRSSCDRDRIYELLMRQPELAGVKPLNVAEVTRQWQQRKISNLEYLLFLNTVADRSFNDLTQYPVLPWLVTDFKSKKLDLDSRETFRDLSKPVGALNPERIQYLRERYRSMPEENPELGVPPRFLYGTHYSTPGYVLFYLVRSAPEYMLCLQDGKFDAADRMFVSMAETWRSCYNNPADLKELIPEFYCSNGDFLRNSDDLQLGVTQGGIRVHDVVLPPWAKSERDFVRKLKKALNESEYASEHVHEWIDLIFGYKQRGEEGLKADNLFYYLTYDGSVDLERMEDPVQRAALEAQIREFGQCPKQIFAGPHPKRSDPLTAPISLTPSFREAIITRPRSHSGDSGGGWDLMSDAVETRNGPPGSATTPMGSNGNVNSSQEWVDLRKDELALSMSVSMVPTPLASPGAKQGSVASPPSLCASGSFKSTLSPRGLIAKGLSFASQLKSPSVRTPATICFDEQAQRVLEDLINQAQQHTSLSDSLSSNTRPPQTPIFLNTASGTIGTSPVTPNPLSITSLLSDVPYQNGSHQPAATASQTNGVPDPLHMPEKRSGYDGLRPPPDGLWTLLGSGALAVHRDKVSCVKLADGGTSVCSTSDDGSFRVSTLEARTNETGTGLTATLKSKRHFSPSDIALSSCALLEDPLNPLAVLGSWDNHVYIFSISSARQILRLDAHDDGVSSLDLKGTRLVSGSWDATVKVWSIQGTGIDPQPIVEFFDHSKQVQSVQLDTGGDLVASGAEDGTVVLCDVRAKASIAQFQATREAEPVVAVRWGVGQTLYVAGREGSVGCWSVDGRCLGSANAQADVKTMEVDAWGEREVLALGGGDGALRLWVAEGLGSLREVMCVPDAHEEAVTCLDIDWAKARIVTGSQDSTMRVWRAASPPGPGTAVVDMGAW